MNWTIRKTKNASVASRCGTISGRYGHGPPTQPNERNITNCGTISTWLGSSNVPIMMANQKPRSRNRSRAKAYAASRHDVQFATTVSAATMKLFRK